MQVTLTISGVATDASELQQALTYLQSRPEIDQASITHDDTQLTLTAVSAPLPWTPNPPADPAS